MDHESVTKQKAHDSAIQEITNFYRQMIGENRRHDFERVRDAKFKERFAELAKLRAKIMNPKDYSVQEYCLACALYTNQAKDLIRSVAIQMLPVRST